MTLLIKQLTAIYLFIILISKIRADFAELYSYDTTKCRSSEYYGTINVAYDGTQCLDWFKHRSFYLPYWTDDEARVQKNYCRNPANDSSGPWCVVAPGRFKYCDVPRCADEVGCYEGTGEDYSGLQDQTSDGHPCTKWRLTNARDFTKGYRFRIHYNATYSKFLTMSDPELIDFRACRNPGGLKTKPWCYPMQERGISSEMQYCDIPKCSAPSILGYPLFNNDSQCPNRFIPQKQLIKQESMEKPTEIKYCIAPQKLLFKQNEDSIFKRFKQYCLFLIGKTEFCPTGFYRTGQLEPSLEVIKHISGPMAWQQTHNNIMKVTLCCTQTQKNTLKGSEPYIMVEKVSHYKQLYGDSPWSNVLTVPSQPGIHLYTPHYISKRSIIYDLDIPEYGSPLFTSIQVCPPVEGTSRLVGPLFLASTQDESIPGSLQHLFPELKCEYYELHLSYLPSPSTSKEDSRIALLINEPVCPSGFYKTPLSRRVIFILGTSISICWPNPATGTVVNTHLPSGQYCMFSTVSKEEMLKIDVASSSEWGMRSNYTCPEGFRNNEINFANAKYRLRLCCSIDDQSSDSKAKPGISDIPSKLQAPFDTRVPFAVIRNGPKCPVFYSGLKKLSLIQYSRPIPKPHSDQIELIGPDNPVDLDRIPNIVMCQYLNPETKLGVMAMRFDCEGLGIRASMSYTGAICGFEINETSVFPPGRYCFRRLSSVCPPEFQSRHTPVGFGLSLRTAENVCCRSEESIGAVKLPIKFSSPFRLPALDRPCQVFEGYNVDAEIHQCVYYPKGNSQLMLIVWPRIADSTNITANASMPKHCSSIPKKRKGIRRSQLGRLSALFFFLLQDQWLTHRRPRWSSSGTSADDICFTELSAHMLPIKEENAMRYCIPVLGTCPNDHFEMIGAAPYMNTVICCTLNVKFMDSEESYPVKSFVTLGRPSPKDKLYLSNFIGTKIVDNFKLDDQPTGGDRDPGCPKLATLQLYRRVVQSFPIPRTAFPLLNGDKVLSTLFNVTFLNDLQFEKLTGIWLHNNTVSIIYCEYISSKYSKKDEQKSWPISNYAIPKSLNDCPKGSSKSVVRHYQDRYGFHYSQPIHLDGIYLKRQQTTYLEYCVFTEDHNNYPSGNYGAEENLPAGHYCVLRVNEACPMDFSEGLLSILEGPERIESVKIDTDKLAAGRSPDITRTTAHIKQSTTKIDRLDYHFCCRADSTSALSPITGFPSETGPFYLYKMGDKCQQIMNMRVSDEYICLDAPNRGDPTWWTLDRNHTWSPYAVKGLTPARIPFHDQCDVEISLCYYEPLPPIYENENIPEQNSTEQWPLGQYALPNVHRSDMSTACPPGFTQKHTSLINHNIPVYDLEILPMSMGPYFLDLIGHNFSALTVHYCERDAPDDNSTTLNNTNPSQWPDGDYCVLSMAMNFQCPPGLHRHSRSVSELCCRSDNIRNPKPVNWPFTEDFFLFGGEQCLPIADTHVERYLIRLTSATDTRLDTHWDVLCHYLPLAWINETVTWPGGEYMLPIGRRGGLKSTLFTIISAKDDKNQSAIKDEKPTNYECPETFRRMRFIFETTDYVQRTDAGDKSTSNTFGRLSMEFCVHNTTSDNNVWPSGDYCVFTMNRNCPVEMMATKELVYQVSRFILKKIELLNPEGQHIPGSYWHEDAENHVVYFMQCCREDKNLVLRLPPWKDGFYTASHTGLCSNIPGTVLDREKVTSYFTTPLIQPRKAMSFIEGDFLLHRDFIHQRDGLLYLCYYHPSKGVDYSSSVLGPEFSVSQNFSEKDLDDIARLCGCASNSFCLLSKQAECVCKPGYFGDGRHVCKEITPLTDECADLCDPAATCTDPLDPPLKKRQFLNHVCICKHGFVGDGYTCRPECSVKQCPPFSRCVHNVVQGTLECECIAGTVTSGRRCHLDIYKTLESERDLPQFVLNHDHCLSQGTQNALRLLEPKRYFYIFVPQRILQSCAEVKQHLVSCPYPIKYDELNAASEDAPIQLITENNTVIEIYLKNGTLIVDGSPIVPDVIKFLNGELFHLSGELKLKKYVNRIAGYKITLIVLGLGLGLCILTILSVYMAKHGVSSRLRQWQPFRRSFFGHRALWSQRGDKVLVEETDDI